METQQGTREYKCREQAAKGLERIQKYLENNDEIDEGTEHFLMEQADRYMNIIQFMNDYHDANNK